MRWLKAVMQRLGKMACLFTTPSVQQEQQSPTAKPLRAKSGRPSKVAQELSQPAQSKPKRKASPARKTTAAVSRKPVQKPAQTTSGRRGRPRKTPA